MFDDLTSDLAAPEEPGLLSRTWEGAKRLAGEVANFAAKPMPGPFSMNGTSGGEPAPAPERPSVGIPRQGQITPVVPSIKPDLSPHLGPQDLSRLSTTQEPGLMSRAVTGIGNSISDYQPQGSPDEAPQLKPGRKYSEFWNGQAEGAAHIATQLSTGLIGQAAAGLAGLGRLVTTGDPAEATRAVEGIGKALEPYTVYHPQTETGKGVERGVKATMGAFNEAGQLIVPGYRGVGTLAATGGDLDAAARSVKKSQEDPQALNEIVSFVWNAAPILIPAIKGAVGKAKVELYNTYVDTLAEKVLATGKFDTPPKGYDPTVGVPPGERPPFAYDPAQAAHDFAAEMVSRQISGKGGWEKVGILDALKSRSAVKGMDLSEPDSFPWPEGMEMDATPLRPMIGERPPYVAGEPEPNVGTARPTAPGAWEPPGQTPSGGAIALGTPYGIPQLPQLPPFTLGGVPPLPDSFIQPSAAAPVGKPTSPAPVATETSSPIASPPETPQPVEVTGTEQTRPEPPAGAPDFHAVMPEAFTALNGKSASKIAALMMQHPDWVDTFKHYGVLDPDARTPGQYSLPVYNWLADMRAGAAKNGAPSEAANLQLYMKRHELKEKRGAEAPAVAAPEAEDPAQEPETTAQRLEHARSQLETITKASDAQELDSLFSKLSGEVKPLDSNLSYKLMKRAEKGVYAAQLLNTQGKPKNAVQQGKRDMAVADLKNLHDTITDAIDLIAKRDAESKKFAAETELLKGEGNDQAPVSPSTEEPIEPPAWHSQIPTEGMPLLGDQHKSRGWEPVPYRLAEDAVSAVTQNQLHNGMEMYLYILPGAGRFNGRARLVPEDQKLPKPWTLVTGEPYRVGWMTKEQLTDKIREALRSEPILAPDTTPDVSEEEEAENAAKKKEFVATVMQETPAATPAPSVGAPRSTPEAGSQEGQDLKGRIRSLNSQIMQLNAELTKLEKSRKRTTSRTKLDAIWKAKGEITGQLSALRKELTPLEEQSNKADLEDVVAKVSDPVAKKAASLLANGENPSAYLAGAFTEIAQPYLDATDIPGVAEKTAEVIKAKATQHNTAYSLASPALDFKAQLAYPMKQAARDAIGALGTLNGKHGEYLDRADAIIKLEKSTSPDTMKSLTDLYHEIEQEQVAAAAEHSKIVAEIHGRAPGEYVLAAMRPLLTKDRVKTVADVVQAFKDGLLGYDKEMTLYANIEDKAKADATLAGIPRDAKVQVGKDKVTIVIKEARQADGEKGKEVKHVFWFNDTPEAVAAKVQGAGADLFQSGYSREPEIYGQARRAMKSMAAEDPDFAKNPVFTVVKHTDADGAISYTFDYHNGTFHMTLNPNAFGFERTGRGDETLLTKAIDQGEHWWKEGDKIALSPGYLEGKSDQVYLVPAESFKGPGGDAFYSAGAYADVPGEEGARPSTREPAGTVPGESAQTLKIMRLPEIIKLARAIMEGSNPQVVKEIRKRPTIRGIFYPDSRMGPAHIQVRADLMKTPGQMERTIAHELGHFADYSPDKTFARGNILGHIATLNDYRKDLLEEYPGSPNRILTGADRDRLHKEAVRQVKAEEEKGDKTIIEEIVREEPIYEQSGMSPEMILAIWNDLTARDKYPELYKVVAGMTSAQKKAIMVQALKGLVAPEVAHLGGRGKVVGTRTVKETRTVVFPSKKATPADIRARYEKLLREEILKRGLYEREVIMAELKAVSYEWRPLPPSPPPVYMRYRNKLEELYADAISALLNSPGYLAKKAPSFTKGFFAYLERKPEFEAAYNDIQAVLNGDFRDMAAGYVDETRQMFKGAQDERNRIAAKPVPERSIIYTMRRGLSHSAWCGEKLALEVEKAGKKAAKLAGTPEAREEALARAARAVETRKLLEDMPYLSSDTKGLVADLYDLIIDPAMAAGASVDDLGVYAAFSRVLSEEGGKASFRGHTYETAQIALAELRRELEGGRFDAAEKYNERFFRWYRDEVLGKPGIEHVIKAKQLAEFRANSGYSRNNVVKYIEKHFGKGLGRFAIHQRIGSFEDIENPFVASAIQALSLAKTVDINNIKLGLLKTMADAGELIPAQLRYSKDAKKKVPVDPGRATPPREFMETLGVSLNGHMQYFYVDQDIARIFHRDPVMANALTKLMGWVMHPVKEIFVGKNPVFQVRNPFRDVADTFINTPENMGWLGVPKLLREYYRVFPEVRAYAMTGKASPLIKEMLKRMALPAERIWRPEEANVEDEITRIADSLILDPNKDKAAPSAMGKLRRFLRWLDRTGNTTELLGQVAGYKFLRDEVGLPEGELVRRTREGVGTPNFKKSGIWSPFTNTAAMFSTVNKSGLEAGARSAKAGPKIFAAKILVAHLLPRLLMRLAKLGVLGFTYAQTDYFKKLVNRIPQSDLDNYVVIPLYLDSKGVAHYWRIPESYAGQMAGQIASAMMRGKITGKGGVLNAMANVNPYNPSAPLTVAYMLSSYYLGGHNTYDPFYQRNHLTDDELAAGGLDAAKALGEETWNSLGMGVFHKMDRGVTRDQTYWEHVLNSAPGNILGTFLRHSDAGLREQFEEPKQQADQDEARLRLRARDAATKIHSAKGAPANLTPAESEGAAAKPGVLENSLLHRELINQGGEEGYLADALSRAKSEREQMYLLNGGRPKPVGIKPIK